MRTHVTWSIDEANRCPSCGEKTALIIAPPYWRTDSEAFESGERAPKNFPEEVEVHDEITGHYCMECERLVSLSLNTAALARYAAGGGVGT